MSLNWQLAPHTLNCPPPGMPSSSTTGLHGGGGEMLLLSQTHPLPLTGYHWHGPPGFKSFAGSHPAHPPPHPESCAAPGVPGVDKGCWQKGFRAKPAFVAGRTEPRLYLLLLGSWTTMPMLRKRTSGWEAWELPPGARTGKTASDRRPSPAGRKRSGKERKRSAPPRGAPHSPPPRESGAVTVRSERESGRIVLRPGGKAALAGDQPGRGGGVFLRPKGGSEAPRSDSPSAVPKTDFCTTRVTP